MIPPELLEILACPVPACRAKLRETPTHLICTACGARYPMTENWPTLIPEEAQPAETSDDP